MSVTAWGLVGSLSSWKYNTHTKKAIKANITISTHKKKLAKLPVVTTLDRNNSGFLIKCNKLLLVIILAEV